MAAEGIPVEMACRVVNVSVSGYYDWLSRPPSARSIRHVWLTDLITEVHRASRGIYGSRRVHAELRLGRGIVVGHGAVELLMRRAGLVGAMGRPKWRRTKPDTIATDLVNRDFTATEPNRKWLTDITEWHQRLTRGGRPHRRARATPTPISVASAPSGGDRQWHGIRVHRRRPCVHFRTNSSAASPGPSIHLDEPSKCFE